MARLQPDQVQRYTDEGYLLFNQPVFAEHDFQALRHSFENLQNAWESSTGKRSENMDVPHFAVPELLNWVLSDAVVDLVEPILGPDIALFSTHFIAKPAGTGQRVPWHEDSSYWEKILQPMDVVTVWLAVDPSTPANGCMRVIPGTHDNGYSDYVAVDKEDNVFATQIADVDESKAVDCILKANECSLHHAKLIHGSEPNTGSMRRCGYTMRFVSTKATWTPGHLRDGFQLYLARGVDHTGMCSGDRNKVNQAWLENNEIYAAFAAEVSASQSVTH